MVTAAFPLIPTGPTPLGSLPPPSALAQIPITGTVARNSGLHQITTTSSSPLLPPTTDLSSAAGLRLSMSLRPVSSRLVQRIHTGEFIDMRDLLQHFEGIHGALGFQVLPMTSCPKVRDVTTLPSWICCFMSYLAVLTTDQLTRERLAYAVLIVSEAMRHGSQGWLEYDRLFRQQAALDQSLPWNVIHPGLQATTILSQRAGQGTFCSLSQESDHPTHQCATLQLQQPTLRNSAGQPTSRPVPRCICSSWNEGNCAFPGTCTYRHICMRCFQPSHPA